MKSEICRLTENPDLFPNSNTQHLFKMVTRTASVSSKKENIKAIEKSKQEKKKRKMLSGTFEDKGSHIKVCLASHEKFMPWEQFLLKNSPGSAIPIENSRPDTSNQAVPLGGAGVYMYWLRDTLAVEEKCRCVGAPSN